MDTPEIGKTYRDTLSYSDTIGQKFTCIEIIDKGKYQGIFYIMKDVITGESGQYNGFDWELIDENN